MPKPRTKRGAIREERKRKRQADNDPTTTTTTKRPRTEDDDNTYPEAQDTYDATPREETTHHEDDGAPEKEFFGMLAEEEQEYFRSADEKLDQNLFDASLGETRENFVSGLFKEAEGKELKLASSQSCSRLMERLIQLSTPAQRKKLFEAFAGHFLSLVQHRFASHCCEALFLRSAPVVTSELAGNNDGFVLDVKGGDVGEGEPMASMEELFLATLDELEGSLSFLVTDRFASHTLRVLLLVLSGRPLNDVAFKTLLKSKKKENIRVTGADIGVEEGLRAVPASFATAVQKIISDSIAGMDGTALRVLAKHPIGNPTLQLLLELDLTLAKDGEKGKGEPALLPHLLPGAPKSLSDESSPAAEFVNGMVYDLIGSRLLETLITHAPGKIFKALNQNIFLPRIQGYVRNDVSCYPAMRVLNRLGKDDLVKAVAQIEPTIPQLVQKARYNVVRTLFERCVTRGLNDEVKKLNKGLKQGCGTETADLVKTLCLIKSEEEKEKKKAEVSQLARNDYAIQSHGAQLLTFLLSVPGPSKGVQESLLSLSAAELLQLAQASLPTVTVLTTALSTPSPNNPAFHKALTARLILPHVATLALSQNGHNLLTKLVEVPSKGRDCSVPFHMKEAVMDDIGNMENDLRGDWMGRSVWRSWKGDIWKTRRGDWKVWMREVDVVEEKGKAPKGAPGKSGGNAVSVGERKPRGEFKQHNGHNVDVQTHTPFEQADAEMEDVDEFKVDIREPEQPEEESEPEPEEKPKKEKKSKDKSEKKEKKDKSEKKEKRSKEEKMAKKEKKAKNAKDQVDEDVDMEE